jgi:hypothetical protein
MIEANFFESEPTEHEFRTARAVLKRFATTVAGTEARATPATGAVRKSDLRAVARALGWHTRDVELIVARVLALNERGRAELRDRWEHVTGDRGPLRRRRRCHLRLLVRLCDDLDW